jgi:arginyl-tRNA synthetase
VIPGDIEAELGRALRAAVAAGVLPAPAAELSASGTWRPAPILAGGGAGTYATSLPFMLARLTSIDPASLAALLADRLGGVPWISSAQVTGGGYLTVTVTAGHLAGVAARTVAAGPACAASDALAGSSVTARCGLDLTSAATWGTAWRSQREALTGRLALAAGATVKFLPAIRKVPPDSTTPAGSSPVPDAVAYYGADAVRYALARTATGRAGAIERQLSVPLDLANPFVAVRYAHADAASTLRWAADLGLTAARAGGSAAGHRSTALPPELTLLDWLSWLPERVAAAARRQRPAELAAYLEGLARAWLDCRASCPALPFGGTGAPRDQAGTAARLLLADAAREALAAGLGLLGVAAPARL